MRSTGLPWACAAAAGLWYMLHSRMLGLMVGLLCRREQRSPCLRARAAGGDNNPRATGSRRARGRCGQQRLPAGPRRRGNARSGASPPPPASSRPRAPAGHRSWATHAPAGANLQVEGAVLRRAWQGSALSASECSSGGAAARGRRGGSTTIARSVWVRVRARTTRSFSVPKILARCSAMVAALPTATRDPRLRVARRKTNALAKPLSRPRKESHLYRDASCARVPRPEGA